MLDFYRFKKGEIYQDKNGYYLFKAYENSKAVFDKIQLEDDNYIILDKNLKLTKTDTQDFKWIYEG